jgi:hypothetical protein
MKDIERGRRDIKDRERGRRDMKIQIGIGGT